MSHVPHPISTPLSSTAHPQHRDNPGEVREPAGGADAGPTQVPEGGRAAGEGEQGAPAHTNAKGRGESCVTPQKNQEVPH